MPTFPPDLFARILRIEKRIEKALKALTIFGTTTDHFESGTVSITIVTANVVVSQAVTFAKPFTAAPRVVLAVESSAPAAVAASVSSITTTGCTIFLNRTAAGTNLVDWLAVL